MELTKSKFKKTEVGLIPEDWVVKSFKEISKVNQGLQISIDKRLKIPTSFSKIYITIQYLNNGKEVEYIDQYNQSVCCAESDVLMTRTGNTGFVVTNVNGVFHNNFFKINFNREKIDKDFLVYFLTQKTTQKTILAKAGTSTIPDLNHNDFYSLEIPLPPTIEEQKEISKALSDVDDLIKNLEKLIAKKKAIKQGAMQQLLTPPNKGGKRLAGFSGEWVKKTIKELCRYQNGTALEKFFNSKEGYKVISIGNYSPDGIYVENKSFIDKSYKSEIEKYILNNGDLTMILNDKTSVGTIIGRVLKINSDEFFVFNQRTMRLTCKELILSDYLYFLINSNFIHNKIVKMAKPGTQIYVNTDDILNLELEFPLLIEEQTQILTILSDINNELNVLETKRVKYNNFKQGMMQELLTGKTRLV
jgi:type I restriction enzyme S subunit